MGSWRHSLTGYLRLVPATGSRPHRVVSAREDVGGGARYGRFSSACNFTETSKAVFKKARIKALVLFQGQKTCTWGRVCSSAILARPNPSEQTGRANSGDADHELLENDEGSGQLIGRLNAPWSMSVVRCRGSRIVRDLGHWPG